MTDATRQADRSPWSRLGAELPDDVKGLRVLLVGPKPDAADLDLGGAETTHWDRSGAPPEGPFDLIVTAEAIQANPHPANLLMAFCDLAAPGARLLLHSRILTDPEHSTYARFVAADGGRGDTEWLPGRLALRWTVETNGFDVERWIDAGSSEPRGEGDAYLSATRNERLPALFLATPVAVDPPGTKGGEA
jgi:hypothetical protein